jgi:hypothetical protein
MFIEAGQRRRDLAYHDVRAGLTARGRQATRSTRLAPPLRRSANNAYGHCPRLCTN